VDVTAKAVELGDDNRRALAMSPGGLQRGAEQPCCMEARGDGIRPLAS
jgi:hypothetical protein